MSNVVSGNTNLVFSFQQIKTAGIPGTQGITAQTGFSFSALSWANGVAANQVDLLYFVRLSLAATPTTIDLTTVLDPFGGTDVFVKGRAAVLYNASTTDGQIITISGGATNPWTNWTTGNVILPAGGKLYFDAPLLGGIPVSGTNKTLKFDPGANTVPLEIGIVGTDA